jgi:hypothetical protein
VTGRGVDVTGLGDLDEVASPGVCEELGSQSWLDNMARASA